MRLRYATPALTVVTLLIGTLLLSPAGGTLAVWFTQAKTSEVTMSTDAYSISATRVPDDREIADTASSPNWNLPGFEVRNDSTTLTRTIAIVKAQLRNRYAVSDQRLNTVLQSAISYRLAPPGGTCDSPGSTELWEVKKDAEPIPDNGVFAAPREARFVLAPGESRQVCFQAVPNESADSTQGRRELFQRFAGAGIKADTYIEATPSVDSDGGDAVSETSYYRVALPQPRLDAGVTDTGVPGCAIAESTTTHGYAKLAWTWPDASNAQNPQKATVIDHWELWSSDDGKRWSQVTDGNYLRAGDWLNAPEYTHGIIPADIREAFIDRGFIRGAGLDGKQVARRYVIVGALKDTTPTRFTAVQGWEVSWNGMVAGFLDKHRCEGTFTTPAGLTGAPNVPGREW